MIINQITNNKLILETVLQNDPSESIWLVSNLKSKLEIQKVIQEKYGYYENETVLRVNEFFKILILRTRPEVKIVSKDHAILLIAQQLSESSESPQQINLKKSAPTIYNYISELASIFVHPQGSERLSDWLNDHEISKKKWGHWFQIGQTIFNWFLNQNLISQDWLSPLLTQVELSNLKIEKKIFVNLGFDILDYEIDILNQLSAKNQITVFDALDSSGNSHFQWPVHSQMNKVKKEIASSKSTQLFKFSTCVNEIKFVTERIRDLIDHGVELTQIVVYAAEIEYFWPVLRRYFAKEGILCSKKSVVKAHSLPSVLKWISEIQLATKQIQFADLEQAQFINEVNPHLKYEKFSELFKNIYEFSDLSRDEQIYKLYSKSIDIQKEIDRNEFITWTIQFWQAEQEQEIILGAFKKLIQEIGSSEVYFVSAWIEYLKKILSQIEMTVHEGDRNGVQISNLYSSFNHDLEYRFFIGLNEGALALSSVTQINESEKNKINSDLGFKISTKSEFVLIHELDWLLSLNSKIDFLSYSATDFSGELTSPHNIWLTLYLNQNKKLPETADVPKLTYWDSLQRADVAEIQKTLPWSSEQKEKFYHRLQVDLGSQTPEETFSIAAPTFSPSSLEKLFKCPFIFAAERLYRLLDPIFLDLEVTTIEQGNIKHAILEWITAQPIPDWTWSFSELDAILDKIVENKKIKIPDPNIWKHQKTKILNSMLKFIELEKDYLSQFSNYKIAFREKEFKFSFNENDPIAIKGKVDRIDEAEGESYLIIDYKSGASSIKSFSKALTEGALQLPIYTMAFDKSFNTQSSEAKNVISSQFYNLKNFKRDQGFLLKDSDGIYFKVGSKKYGYTQSEKNNFLNQIQEEIIKKVDKLKSGLIEPDPIDPQLCTHCNWRTLCRAPHLY